MHLDAQQYKEMKKSGRPVVHLSEVRLTAGHAHEARLQLPRLEEPVDQQSQWWTWCESVRFVSNVHMLTHKCFKQLNVSLLEFVDVSLPLEMILKHCQACSIQFQELKPGIVSHVNSDVSHKASVLVVGTVARLFAQHLGRKMPVAWL